jgi:hypothetical protein
MFMYWWPPVSGGCRGASMGDLMKKMKPLGRYASSLFGFAAALQHGCISGAASV